MIPSYKDGWEPLAQGTPYMQSSPKGDKEEEQE